MMHTARIHLNWLIVISTLPLSLAGATVSAHPSHLAQARLQIDTKTKSYELLVTCDVTAMVMGYAPGYLSDDLPVQMARFTDEQLAQRIKEIQDWFASQTIVLLDHRASPEEVRFPAAVEIRKQAMMQVDEEHHEDEDDHAARVLTIAVKGAIAENVRTMSVRLPSQLGTVVLTARRDAIDLPVQLLAAGQTRQLLLVSDKPMSANSDASSSVPMNCLPDDPEPQHSVPPGVITAGQFLALGFWHIIPEGLDHILFVLGLFLLSAHFKPLLWQVTAFTLAHSVTLALAMYDIVRLPSNIVEPLIAASIAFIAIENLFTTKLQPWRPIVVFAFGLLHGLGFAGVLSELALPAGQFAPAIIGFNIGVEMGQLAVIGLAFLAVGWLREWKNYRKAIIIPASLAIAIIGIYWSIERVMGG